jgi:GTPase
VTPGRDEQQAFRSGFVTLVGRPNVGKSTLVNRLVGSKVSIVSDKPQTTRNEIRGVLHRPGAQVVLVDTPGIHRPRTLLGERSNERARATLAEVDVICAVVEATRPYGPGDRFVATAVQAAGPPTILVVNKVDAASRDDVMEHLATAVEELGAFDAFVPLSASTGEGCDALVAEIVARLPEGPHYYPDGMISDAPESFVAAEILREQLLAVARDELPHSIAVLVDEVEEHDRDGEPLLVIRARVVVERPSQKGIVIGKGGAVLKRAGTAARRELEALLGAKVFLETTVRVDRDWQRRAGSLDRMGF